MDKNRIATFNALHHPDVGPSLSVLHRHFEAWHQWLEKMKMLININFRWCPCTKVIVKEKIGSKRKEIIKVKELQTITIIFLQLKCAQEWGKCTCNSQEKQLIIVRVVGIELAITAFDVIKLFHTLFWFSSDCNNNHARELKQTRHFHGRLPVECYHDNYVHFNRYGGQNDKMFVRYKGDKRTLTLACVLLKNLLKCLRLGIWNNCFLPIRQNIASAKPSAVLYEKITDSASHDVNTREMGVDGDKREKLWEDSSMIYCTDEILDASQSLKIYKNAKNEKDNNVARFEEKNGDKEYNEEIGNVDLNHRKWKWMLHHRPRVQSQSMLIYPVFNVSVRQLMQHEVLRIRSFDHYPIKDETISVTLLAKAGFYFGGSGRQVICFSCQAHQDTNSFDIWTEKAHGDECKRLTSNIPFLEGLNRLTSADWELFASAFKKKESCSGASGHLVKSSSPGLSGQDQNGSRYETSVMEAENREAYSVYHVVTSATKSEPFLFNPKSNIWRPYDSEYWSQSNAEGREVGSDDEVSPLLDLRGAVYPLFANRKIRHATFYSWDPSHIQRPEVLVDLGFFYAGYSDCARCFYCGLGLKYWRPTDEAAYQHARFRPGCLYNRFLKGQEFIDEVQRNVAANSRASNEAGETSSGPNSSTEEVSNLDQLMRSEAAKQVMEEGWTRNQTRRAVVELVQGLGEECLVYDILLEVLNNHGRLRSSQQESEQSSAQQSTDGDDEPDIASTAQQNRGAESDELRGKEVETDTDYDVVAATTQPPEASLDPQLILRLLERENSYMKKRLNCTVCGQSKIGCVYLPCGHVVACQPCGDLASNCASCGKVIHAIANIYMS